MLLVKKKIFEYSFWVLENNMIEILYLNWNFFLMIVMIFFVKMFCLDVDCFLFLRNNNVRLKEVLWNFKIFVWFFLCVGIWIDNESGLMSV